MKIIMLGMAAFLFTLNIQAQNTNIKTEVKTNVLTTKDSKGEKKIIKTQEIKEVQNVELKDADSNVLNKDIQASPVQVTATTAVSADGVTKVIEVDRSAYYNLGGKKYKVATDTSGYTMFLPDGKKEAILRRTSNNNYIFRTKNATSYGYFDANGNLVLESYDDKTDKVTVTTYIIVKQ
ncbi:hypothetical protein H4V97_002921 [Flavobacterium sp. CG_23.5]|uniref:hypothetical protein n=1 Tax=unclassified Flavobacterium TaxID=196869 RepID=UPI0018C9A4FB|nr:MULTISPECIES: hypothetical protein [unclassified Flavobacterium]MBG6109567.1 hypothetical protein [Flavobacterium sp. CG_9.10]MBP2284603.1 hypothetical protein [Flavobacterium sp. CG_23.5]